MSIKRLQFIVVLITLFCLSLGLAFPVHLAVYDEGGNEEYIQCGELGSAYGALETPSEEGGKEEYVQCGELGSAYGTLETPNEEGGKKDFIKWVDLNFTDDILNKVYQLDIKYNATRAQNAGMIRFKFVEVLAYLATKNGNNFSASDAGNLEKLVKKLESGYSIADEYGQNKYYNYYLKAFSAVFDQFIGVYRLPSGEVHYGLTAYFPLARGYWYNHYDDFGSSRNYGFKRRHLGHDIMGGVGTPIIAIEGGTVTELGWNKYGGWRVGILSLDKTRYYYYAHLRKNHPFVKSLEIGSSVSAGQVIGYLGMTGYSTTENVNLKSGKPHLHLGLQLIFDESQVKGNKEIWVDLYAITSFLQRNRAKTVLDKEANERKSIDTRQKIDL